MPDAVALMVLSDSDEVTVRFKTPPAMSDGRRIAEGTGTVGMFAGLAFLQCRETRDSWGRCSSFGPLTDRDTIERGRIIEEIRKARKVRALGDLVFAQRPLSATAVRS